MEIGILIIAVCIFLAFKVAGDADENVHAGCGALGIVLLVAVIFVAVAGFASERYVDTGTMPEVKIMPSIFDPEIEAWWEHFTEGVR